MGQDSAGKEALKTAARTFAALVKANLKVFRGLCSGRENTEVTGDFIEELLREYINSWLSPMGIYPGSLCRPNSDKMMQIDGLIWQPSFGPPLLKQSNFLLLHPIVARAVVEIKTSVKSIKKLHDRLVEIWTAFLSDTRQERRDALGIILWHDSPETAAEPKWHRVDGHLTELHTRALDAHPIFILFRRTGDYEYEPFMPAIEAMLFAFNYIANTPRLNTLI